MSTRRRLFALVTAVLAMLALAWAGGSSAQAAGFTPINVWNSSHCLDNATENAAKLQMWSCTGGAEQKWLEGFNTQTSLFTFTNQNTGRCITAPASGTGTVTMAFCNAAAANQQWRVYYADNPKARPRAGTTSGRTRRAGTVSRRPASATAPSCRQRPAIPPTSTTAGTSSNRQHLGTGS